MEDKKTTTKPAAPKAASAKKPTAEKAVKKNEATPPSEDNDTKEHILDKMIDFTYAATTKIPFGGKYAKEALDRIDAKERTKKFTDRFFKPFFFFPKLPKNKKD